MREKKRISEETLSEYIKSLDRHLKPGIVEPKQIPQKGKEFAKAVRNFLNFLESEYYIDSLNGFSWRCGGNTSPYDRRKNLTTKSSSPTTTSVKR